MMLDLVVDGGLQSSYPAPIHTSALAARDRPSQLEARSVRQPSSSDTSSDSSLVDSLIFFVSSSSLRNACGVRKSGSRREVVFVE